MLRLVSFGIVVVAYYLAHLAIPPAGSQQSVPFRAELSVTSTQPLASFKRHGRLPEKIFGLGDQSKPIAALPDDGIQTSRIHRIASVTPPPSRKTTTKTTRAHFAEVRPTAHSTKAEQHLTSSVIPTATETTYRQRRQIARLLQRELRRVGCYGGSIDGIWGAQSEAAIRAFAARASADLSFTQPTHNALKLVELYEFGACENIMTVAAERPSGVEQTDPIAPYTSAEPTYRRPGHQPAVRVLGLTAFSDQQRRRGPNRAKANRKTRHIYRAPRKKRYGFSKRSKRAWIRRTFTPKR